MSKIDDFKVFVKKNPSLVKYVNNGEMTWQKFYEMYDLYGENDDIWKKYIVISTASVGVSDLLSYFKNINLDSIQNGVNNLQRVLGVLGDIKGNNTSKEEYKPRPIYKHFDD